MVFYAVSAIFQPYNGGDFKINVKFWSFSGAALKTLLFSKSSETVFRVPRVGYPWNGAPFNVQYERKSKKDWGRLASNTVRFFLYLGFFIPLEIFSLIWRCHTFWPMIGTYDTQITQCVVKWQRMSTSWMPQQCIRQLYRRSFIDTSLLRKMKWW